MRGALALGLVALLMVVQVPAAGEAPDGGPGTSSVVPFTILVNGQPATGLLGVPASGTSNVLVVLCHGHGGSAQTYAATLNAIANRGWLGVAMNYRGDPRGYNALEGAEDTLAATKFLQARHPIQRTVLYGMSMGGHVSGMAIMDGPGLYDYWVSAVGVSNWPEMWAWVRARGDTASPDGPAGSPLTNPTTYVLRSPALHPTAFLASGLTRAYLLYGVADTNVPATQGYELSLNLLRQGVPVSRYTVLDSTAGVNQPGHTGFGMDLVFRFAAGGPPTTPLPYVDGVLDLASGTYTPPS